MSINVGPVSSKGVNPSMPSEPEPMESEFICDYCSEKFPYSQVVYGTYHDDRSCKDCWDKEKINFNIRVKCITYSGILLMALAVINIIR